jgi:tetratricopeptide (TPR) repeat protein
VLFAYYLTLAALAAAAWIPGGRVWGVAAWRHVPREAAALACLAGALMPFVLRLARRRAAAGGGHARPASGVALAALATGAWFVLFVTLRARAHYLGDGWQSLALLGAARPYVKPDAPLTGLVLCALSRAFGGGERAALLAYQSVAVAAGALFCAAVASLGRSLVPSPADRRRLFLLLVSGGWSLLFFGYVENYALFTATVAAYTLAGARAARDGKGKGIATTLALLAAAWHVAGLVLVPSVAALWLGGSRASARLSALPRAGKIALSLAAALALAVASARLLAGDASRMLLFVPPAPTRFTVDGYTLFSAKHLLDVANLLLLAVPGIAPLAVAVARAPRRSLARDGAMRFLGVLGASTALAVFVLDPKLGMPRDWDLYSFAAIPWALAVFLVLEPAGGASTAPGRRALDLAAALGVLVLLPRAATNANEDAAYRQFRDHLALDHSRGRAARIHAVNHWKRIGRDDLADREVEAWNRDYPERVLVRDAADARARGDVAEAVRLNRAAIVRAPAYSDPWNNLGSIDLTSGRIDAAREELEIARALSPNEPSIWMNLGTACFVAGDLDGASRWWRRAWERSPDGSLVNKSLARLAQRRGDVGAYERYLSRAAAAPEAPGALLVEWGDHLAAGGRTEEASAAYGEALRRGLPDEARRALLAVHPELAETDDLASPHPGN